MPYMYASLAVCICLMGAIPAYAQTGMSVNVEKNEYGLGDQLVFTLTVPSLSHGTATLTLLHEGQSFAEPVEIKVGKKTATYPPAKPFDSFSPPGNWTLNVRYGQSVAEDAFVLVHSDSVLLPEGFRELGSLWVHGVVTDLQYGEFLSALHERGIVKSQIPERISSVSAPDWFKTATAWWSQGHTSDSEYVSSIDYLIPKIIVLE